ncbi:MAG: MbtH family protein [Stenotrophomonas sp.]
MELKDKGEGMDASAEDLVVFLVVVNDDAQYSVLPSGAPLPAGWREAGVTGSKAECLAHVAVAWADIRPSRGPSAPSLAH